MRFLSADDPLPYRPARVLVSGTSGAGKSTLAKRIGAALALPYTEIDALYHGPQWVPRERFVADVESFSSTPRWVTEWQYTPVRPMLSARADLLVWLDLPVAQVMARVIHRTVMRSVRRQELWNGNHEPPLSAFFTSEDHVVRWAWRTRHYAALRASELQRARPELPIVRLTRQREVDRWVQQIEQLAAQHAWAE